jgi:hypothetical protein
MGSSVFLSLTVFQDDTGLILLNNEAGLKIGYISTFTSGLVTYKDLRTFSQAENSIYAASFASELKYYYIGAASYRYNGHATNTPISLGSTSYGFIMSADLPTCDPQNDYANNFGAQLALT